MIRLAILSLALATPALAASTAPDAKFARLTAGQTAQTPVQCVRPEGIVQPEVIAGRSLAYRTPRGLFVGPLTEAGAKGGGCQWLRDGRTMVTSSINGQLCRGDRVRILESGMLLGQCVFGDFTPYTKGN